MVLCPCCSDFMVAKLRVMDGSIFCRAVCNSRGLPTPRSAMQQSVSASVCRPRGADAAAGLSGLGRTSGLGGHTKPGSGGAAGVKLVKSHCGTPSPCQPLWKQSIERKEGVNLISSSRVGNTPGDSTCITPGLSSFRSWFLCLQFWAAAHRVCRSCRFHHGCSSCLQAVVKPLLRLQHPNLSVN